MPLEIEHAPSLPRASHRARFLNEIYEEATANGVPVIASPVDGDAIARLRR